MKFARCIALAVTLCLAAGVGTSVACRADEPQPSRIVVQGAGGVSMSSVVRSVDVSKAEYSRTGVAGNLRVLWRPGYRLAIGAEVGSVGISSLTVKSDSLFSTGSSMNLTAIPMMAVFAMEWYGVELSAGPGVVLYQFNGSADNQLTQSSDIEIAWSVGVQYFLPINSSLRVGIGARELVIPERRVNSTAVLAGVEWSWL
jgi:hypothetical protein